MSAAGVPFTERQNPITDKLDEVDPAGRVRLLARCDRQVVDGVEGFARIGDEHTVRACARVAAQARRTMAGGDGIILLSGAGTSGRLAYFLARRCNERLERRGQRPCVRALLAGGPRAFARSIEGAEDDLEMAEREAAHALAPSAENVFIGITCGLSAPWVAGGVRAAIAHGRTDLALLGFNPAEMARPAFRATVAAVSGSSRGTCLLPVVGAEAVAGSTRMKGGSATLLVLASILELAMEAREDADDASRRLSGLLARFERALAPLGHGAFVEELATLCRHAGEVLQRGGSIVYLGRGLPGVLGVIDASECPPTFGASPDQVRGYVEDGYAAILPAAERAPELEEHAPIDLSRYRAQAAGARAPLQITIAADGAALRVESGAPQRTVALGHSDDEVVALLRLKLALNAITTTAFVQNGKVFGNRMIDLRISNTKLFDRAVRIVAEVARVDNDTAERAVIGAIHGTDAPDRPLIETPVLAHVAAATGKARVVPLAILRAGAGMAGAEAARLLDRQPLIRRALREALSAS